MSFVQTGVIPTHEEIKDNWVGKDTRFGFFDGYLVSCDPVDDGGLGTHNVALAVGKTVGVAPQATWMMCQACVSGGCYESALKICAEWLACPYECGDETEDKVTKNCTMKPHVVSVFVFVSVYILLCFLALKYKLFCKIWFPNF